MATTQNLTALLKRYQPYNLIMEEMKRRNYFWNKVKKKTGWAPGSTMTIPFEGGEYSSMAFGALTDSSDVANMTAVAGTLSTQPELWGTMKFAERDLDAATDLEKAFATLVPAKTKQFVERMTDRVSMSLLHGHVARIYATWNGADADDATNGVVYVDHPERFTLGERIYIDDDNSSPITTAYVTAIDRDTHLITVKDARSAGAAVNLSSYVDEAQNPRIFLVGGVSSGFTSLRSQILSSANGGAATQFGETKTAYPILQGQNFSGDDITADNILEVVNDYFFDTARFGSGNASEIIMSYKNFKNCVAGLQANNKRYSQGDKSAGYGFRSIELMGPENDYKITGLKDLDDKEMYIIDWSTLTFHGHEFFQRKRHFNGEEFFLERATSGFNYLIDIKLQGDLVCSAPSHNGVIHSISYVD